MSIFLIVTAAISILAAGQQLVVEQPKQQPELRVQQSNSRIYEDGSVELQPAKAALQQTARHNQLQGN